MDLYVILYHHKHGVTPCVNYFQSEPTKEQMYAALEDAGEDMQFMDSDDFVEAIRVGPIKEPEPSRVLCDSKGCPGWAVFNEGEIQRCDVCKRFKSDDEAISYVKALEELDVGRHFENRAHRALVLVREELAGVIEEAVREDMDSDELIRRLESMLGRAYWLERHRWSEHGMQFARLLSAIYSTMEESEDTETTEMEPGYFSVKIDELEELVGMPWNAVMDLFERAAVVFESEKAPPESEG